MNKYYFNGNIHLYHVYYKKNGQKNINSNHVLYCITYDANQIPSQPNQWISPKE